MEDKLRMTIKEFSEKINVSTRTIMRLEESGKLTPNMTLTGKRFYTEEHIKKFFGEV